VTLEIGEIVVTDESPRDSSESYKVNSFQVENLKLGPDSSTFRNNPFQSHKSVMSLGEVSPYRSSFFLWYALIENFVLDKMMLLKPIYHRAQREVYSPVENGSRSRTINTRN